MRTSRPMIRHLGLFLFACLFAGLCLADPFAREVIFSESELQSMVERARPLEKRYGEWLALAIRTPPTIRLGEPPGKIGLTARLEVAVLGGPPVPFDVIGHAGLRYDDQNKAFFLDNPVIESVESVGLPKELQPQVRKAASQLVAAYFRERPVYVLREDSNAQEKAARWLLRSVRIEPQRAIAVLSPF